MPIVLERGAYRVVAIDSAGEMTPEHRGQVIVCGSHGAPNSTQHVGRFEPAAVIFHDAGRGKDDYAISCLHIYEASGLPCATVDCLSARIGDARDMFDEGVLSAVNAHAAAIGLEVGMSVREAASRLLEHSSAPRV